MRYFNWKLAIVLLLGIGIIAGTVVGLHHFQKTEQHGKHLTEGQAFFKQGQWEDAATALGKYIARNRQDPNALHQYAEAQLKIRPSRPSNIDQAIGSYRGILRIKPEDRKAARQLVELYIKTRAIGEARLVAQRFLENQEDVKVEALLAQALIYQRRFSEAYEKLRSVIENEPNQIAAYEQLAGITEENPNDYSLPSAHWLDLAVENNPESPGAYLARARFNLTRQKKADALQDMETALTKNIADAQDYMTAALLYRAVDQMDRVQEQLKAIRDCEPDNLGLWIFQAGAAMVSQDKDKMRVVADDAMANLKEERWSFYPLATELYVRADALDQASACLEKLRELGDRSAEVAYLEGLKAYQQDHVQEAVLNWRRAMSLGYRSASPSMQHYLGFKPMPLKLLLASAQEQLGDSMSSHQLLEVLASEDKEDLLVQLSLARYRARTGDWAQAKVHTQQVLAVDPNNKEAIQLNLEADVRLLSRQNESVSPLQWQNIQQKLDRLEGTIEDTVALSLLRFQIALDQNDLQAARQILGSIDPNDPSEQRKVTMAWINLLSDQDQEDEIIARLKTAVERHDQSPEMVRLLAHFLLKQEQNEVAEQVLRDAYKRMEKPLDSLKLGYILSGLLNQWGREKDREEFVKQLDTDYPDTIGVQRQLLRCQNNVDALQKSQPLVDKIRSLEGDDGWQWKYEQARLWYGSAQGEFQNTYSEAVSLLQQNVRSNAGDQASRMLLAATYLKAGETSLALSTYRDALKREPDNLSIVIPVVKALQDAEELDEADAILRRFAKMKQDNPYLDRLQVSSHLRRGEVASAVTAMEECLEDDPNNVGVALDLARLKVSEREYDVAQAWLDKIRENTQDESIVFRVERLEIQMLLLKGASDEALVRCDKLVESFKSAESLKLRSSIRAGLGRLDEAIDDLEEAIELSQDDADLWVRKSALHLSLQDDPNAVDNAIDAAKTAMNLAPEDPNVVVYAIDLYTQTKDPEHAAMAQALLQKASREHADDPRFKILEVSSMLRDGDAVSQVQAEDLLEQYTIDHPKEVVVWRMLGEIYMTRRDYAKAQNVAIRGLTELRDNFALLRLKARAEMQISPSFAAQTLEAMLEQVAGEVAVEVGLAINLAGAYIRAEKPEKALEVLSAYKERCTKEEDIQLYEYTMLSALMTAKKATEADALLEELKTKHPNDQRNTTVQIQYLISEGDFDAVEQEAARWLETNPNDIAPLEYAAIACLRLGHRDALETSSSLLSLALKQQPKSEPLLMLLAQANHIMGEVEEAKDLYEEILKVNARNVIAMNNVAWIYGHDLNDMERALKLAQEGLALAPQYTDLLDTYGTLCYLAEEYDKAIKSLVECLGRPTYQRQDSTAATMYTLARCYQANGEKLNALKMFQKCIERNRQIQRGGLSLAQHRDAEAQIASLGN